MISDLAFLGIKFGDWLALIGFAAAIYTATKAVKSANRAAQEARNIGTQFRSLRANSELVEISKTFELIKALNRLAAPQEYVLHFYSDVATKISRHCTNSALNEKDRRYLEDTLDFIRETETLVESSGHLNENIDMISINHRLSGRLDKITQIISTLEEQHMDSMR